MADQNLNLLNKQLKSFSLKQKSLNYRLPPPKSSDFITLKLIQNECHGAPVLFTPDRQVHQEHMLSLLHVSRPALTPWGKSSLGAKVILSPNANWKVVVVLDNVVNHMIQKVPVLPF